MPNNAWYHLAASKATAASAPQARLLLPTASLLPLNWRTALTSTIRTPTCFFPVRVEAVSARTSQVAQPTGPSHLGDLLLLHQSFRRQARPPASAAVVCGRRGGGGRRHLVLHEKSYYFDSRPTNTAAYAEKKGVVVEPPTYKMTN